MLLEIDLQSETPIYAQLAQQIIEGIACRQLLPGEALPSVRSMASDLGINLHTVNKAYHLLRQEGYVQINRKQGVIVQPDGFPAPDEALEQKLRLLLRPLVAEAICRGLQEDRFSQLAAQVFADMTKEENKHDG